MEKLSVAGRAGIGKNEEEDEMKGFSNMKVSVKLVAGFLIVSGIAAVIGIIGIRNMGTIKEMEDTMYLSELMGLAHVQEANLNLIEADRAEKNIILSQTQADRDKEVQLYKDLTQENRREHRRGATAVREGGGQSALRKAAIRAQRLERNQPEGH
jgi:hypothetical protein